MVLPVHHVRGGVEAPVGHVVCCGAGVVMVQEGVDASIVDERRRIRSEQCLDERVVGDGQGDERRCQRQ